MGGLIARRGRRHHRGRDLREGLWVRRAWLRRKRRWLVRILGLIMTGAGKASAIGLVVIALGV